MEIDIKTGGSLKQEDSTSERQFNCAVCSALTKQLPMFLDFKGLTFSVREPHLCLCKQVGSRPAAE